MNISRLTVSAAALISAAVLGSSVSAQTAMSPMDKADREWIRVTGHISNVTPQGFRIDYGDGSLPVEMDGFLPTSTQGMRNGDWVTVSGRIDDSMWERRTIEASSVYNSRMQERLWANAADEEGDYTRFSMIDVPEEGEWLGVTGQVVSVDHTNDEMVVDVGSRTMQVDLTDMGAAVLADRGDRVSVYGQLDDADLWNAREIDASSVIILQQG